ncbi:protein NO VEIN domain-containing protein [Dactylosporangium roseum]
MTEPITSNRAVENAAIMFVIAHEAACGRTAYDARGTGGAGDVASEGRVIEVKAYGGSACGQDLWLEPRQIEEALGNADFWLYVVENVRQGDPAQFSAVYEYSGSSHSPCTARCTGRSSIVRTWAL